MLSKRVLIINSGCLTVNCSANLCHIAYIQGFLDCGCDVTVISKSNKGQKEDQSLILPRGAKYIQYDGSKLASHASEGLKATITKGGAHKTLKSKLASLVKKTILKLYGPMGVAQAWINNVVHNYKDELEYDLVLSLSGPVPSHMAGAELIQRNKVKTKYFCELWEDPWQLDLFNDTVDPQKLKIEERMTNLADKVLYVSPLTLENQKRMFSISCEKMDWLPLPYYYKDTTSVDLAEAVYGYFGDYYPQSRNIIPFYNAAKSKGVIVNICGNPSGIIKSMDRINVMPRVSLDVLKQYEDQTNILVLICNLSGGQIPGKIYQYAATNKRILFILDGNDHEKKVLKKYFSGFNRFYFCENTVEDISKMMEIIETDKTIDCSPVEYFAPKNIALEIMKKCGMVLD